MKVNDLVCKAVPPLDAAYQSTVFETPVTAALIVNEPDPHLDESNPVAAAGKGFTVAVTASLVAETQPVVVLRDSA